MNRFINIYNAVIVGKLSQEQIGRGYRILKNIEKALSCNGQSSAKLSKLSSEFYTHIPHDFGFRKDVRIYEIINY